MISANECEEALTLNKESVLTSTPVKVIIFISYIDNRRLEFKLKALSGNFVGPWWSRPEGRQLISTWAKSHLYVIMKVFKLTSCHKGRMANTVVSTKYVFCSSKRVQKVGTNFVVHNQKQIEKRYKDYKDKYLKWHVQVHVPLIFQ